jgi:predicted dehydrogenase
MRDGKVGIVFVGTGSIAAYHLDGLAQVPEAALRWIVGRDPARTAALAARRGAAASTDLSAVLRRDDVDAAIVATPDDTHEPIALAVARAGKALMLQKPMAADAAACRRILAAFADAGCDLQVSFMHRYFGEFVAAQALVASGAIGPVRSIRLRNATPGPDWADWFFDPARVSGGVVHQLGVHGLDLLGLLAGPIADVSARVAILKPTRKLADGREVAVGNPDSAWASYGFASGIVASHEMSMIEAAGCDRYRMEIYGDDGTLWLRGEPGALALRRRGDNGWACPAVDLTPAGARHHRRWIDGLLDRTPRETTAADALAGIVVAEAIAESARNYGATLRINADSRAVRRRLR